MNISSRRACQGNGVSPSRNLSDARNHAAAYPLVAGEGPLVVSTFLPLAIASRSPFVVNGARRNVRQGSMIVVHANALNKLQWGDY